MNLFEKFVQIKRGKSNVTFEELIAYENMVSQCYIVAENHGWSKKDAEEMIAGLNLKRPEVIKIT